MKKTFLFILYTIGQANKYFYKIYNLLIENNKIYMRDLIMITEKYKFLKSQSPF